MRLEFVTDSEVAKRICTIAIDHVKLKTNYNGDHGTMGVFISFLIMKLCQMLFAPPSKFISGYIRFVTELFIQLALRYVDANSFSQGLLNCFMNHFRNCSQVTWTPF